MAERGTVLVDELVDRQKLTGRNYFVLGLLLVALLCDGFDCGGTGRWSSTTP